MSVVLLVFLIALVVWIYRRNPESPPVPERRPFAQPPRSDVPGRAEELPTFQVVALGLQGSGKTLLLASMYHRLQSPAGQSYYLRVPSDADRMQLNQVVHADGGLGGGGRLAGRNREGGVAALLVHGEGPHP
ncbi:hypothetical protein ACGFYU_36325 [Streptomyces sp. NPDC048337]|uniref:hypothetical protein n=1 Tax=Streptomyces sp. NPDC048337 TaxID=3365535 RepID=UPI0037239808